MKVPSNKLLDVYNYYTTCLCSLYEEKEARSLVWLLLDEFFGLRRVDLVLNREMRLNESELLRIHFAVKELMTGCPVQYVVGSTCFGDLRLKVTPSVLIPRPETLEIVDRVVKEAGEKTTFLDLGTGSGCIAISLAKRLENVSVTAVDKSPEALAVAEANARENEVDVRFLLDDILNPSEMLRNQRFDVIVSNPPYVRESEKKQMHRNVKDFEPSMALFVPDDDPLIFYRAIFDLAKVCLNEGGKIYLEINEFLGEEMLLLAKEKGFKASVFRDFRGRERELRIEN